MNARDLRRKLDPSEYVDMFGRQINEGDYIVYGAVDNRSGTLRAGQVIKLTCSKEEERVYDHKLDTYVFRHVPKLFVKSWSNFVSQGYGDKPRSGRQKNVTLGFLDRLIVVPPHVVSHQVRKDLEDPIPPSPWA
jgi:hypothetical protein